LVGGQTPSGSSVGRGSAGGGSFAAAALGSQSGSIGVCEPAASSSGELAAAPEGPAPVPTSSAKKIARASAIAASGTVRATCAALGRRWLIIQR
jgi:hypothetical protein